MDIEGEGQESRGEAAAFRWPSFISERPSLWVSIAVIAIIFILSVIQGGFGKIGFDNDDLMRFVQVRDFLEGQHWFNTDQLRLGLAGGTDMHWSRLPDIPLIILSKFFGLFVSAETALQIAYTIWPPLSAGLLIFAAVKGARFWNGHDAPKNKTYVFTLILLTFFIFTFYRFKPGAIDHHNIQMGLVCLAMAFALDSKYRFGTFFVAGLAIALSLAVGVEVYIFAAIVCGFVALNWLFMGAEAKAGTQGFGLGLMLGLVSSFFGTIAPSEYSRVLCDSLSLITVSAGTAGGLGLVIAATAFSGTSQKGRFLVLGGVGVLCAAILTQQAPQCLANPLNVIPEQVDRLWLSKVTEAQPLRFSDEDALAQIPYLLGPPLLALFLLFKARWNSYKHDKSVWHSHVLVIFLLLASVALTVYQMRFYVFAYVFSILPLAAWIGRVHQSGLHKLAQYNKSNNGAATSQPSNIKYIGALALSLPFMWGLPGVLLDLAKNGTEDTSEDKSVCYSNDVMEEMAKLPKGFVMATSNGGAPLLAYTEHRSMSGNYHRNIAGIALQIEIAATAPEAALAALTEHGVDYVHMCKTDVQTKLLIEENENGLYAALIDGKLPPYLTQLLTLEEGVVSVYRVSR